jgi:hypothetical protein
MEDFLIAAEQNPVICLGYTYAASVTCWGYRILAAIWLLNVNKAKTR